MTLNDFIPIEYTVKDVEACDYKNLHVYIDAARAIARNNYNPIFIVDLHKRTFVYASTGISYLSGLSTKKFTSDGKNLYLDFIPEEEVKIISEILSKSYELFNSFPKEERRDVSLSYYLHLQNDDKKRLLFNKITPLKMTDDGQLWLALCSFSISSRKTPGYIVMKKYKTKEFFLYSLKNHTWYHKEGLSLNEEERDILRLSSQGYTVKEIAVLLHKSEDTIKSYKRVLFSKLGVKNITEAVFAAINYELFC